MRIKAHKMITKKIVLFLMLIGFQLSAQTKKWTLEECVDYAIKNNISVQQSELDLKNASINKKDALGAFLPSINGNASHSWNIGLNQNITTGLLENQTTQFTSAGLNVGVDIYNGLRNQLQLRKSNLQIIASQYQLTKMQEDIALNVANAYLQILFNKENLKVQLQQKQYNLQQLERTKELVEAGVVPNGDLLDIKATVASEYACLLTATDLGASSTEVYKIYEADLKTPHNSKVDAAGYTEAYSMKVLCYPENEYPFHCELTTMKGIPTPNQKVGIQGTTIKDRKTFSVDLMSWEWLDAIEKANLNREELYMLTANTRFSNCWTIVEQERAKGRQQMQTTPQQYPQYQQQIPQQ